MLARNRERVTAVAAGLAVLSGCGDITPPPGVGTIEVVVVTFGGDRDRSYEVVVDNQVKYVAFENRLVFTVESGSRTVTLNQVAANCTVAGSNTVSIDVESGRSVKVAFTVNCDATGVRISTRTSGTDTPNAFELRVGTTVVPIGLTDSRTLSPLNPGEHVVRITMPGENCSVAGANPVAVTVVHRQVTPVTFEIECVAPVRREKVAYHAEVATLTSPNEIFLANPDGSGETSVAFGQHASWSPDGKRLVYSSTFCDWYYGCSSGLGILDPETRASAAFSFHVGVETPAWSPDGDAIAFVEPANGALYLMAPSGGSAVHFAIPSALRVREPAWSPDGKRIALACSAGGNDYDICVINRDRTGLVRLVQRPSIDTRPAWSPDGNTIAFTVAPAPEAEGQIAVVPAAGGDITFITQGNDPSWSRDGTRLIFSRTDGLFTVNLDGTGLTRLTTGKHRAPAWRK